MESYDTQEFRSVVLQAGYDLIELQGYEEFDGATIGQHLDQSGMQDIPTAVIRKACESLQESGLFTEANYGTMMTISASGIDQAEGESVS